jgi:acetyl esterase
MPDLAGMRRHVAAGNALCAAGPDVETEDVSLGGVRTRVYHGAPGRTLVWCHGGGWVTGDLEYSDELCRFLARDAKCTVVSVDYRLAPEHPFPAALDDARAVLASLDGPLAVGGDSAGANLAAVCAREYRVAFQVLVYPVTDHDFTRPSYLRDTPLGAEAVRWFWDLYVPDVSMRDRSDVSPLRGDLAGLPPAHIVVAGNDPLHDEGVAYADSLRVAGVPVTVTDYPSLVHGFLRPADRSSQAPSGRSRSPCTDGSLRKLRSLGADPAARAAVPELTSAVETLFDHATARAK